MLFSLSFGAGPIFETVQAKILHDMRYTYAYAEKLLISISVKVLCILGAACEDKRHELAII